MSTTVPSSHVHVHHDTFERAALIMALLALVAALAALAGVVTHLVTTPTTTGIVVSERGPMADSAVKTAGGVVRPFETGIDRAGAYVPVPVHAYADQPPGILQRGPVS